MVEEDADGEGVDGEDVQGEDCVLGVFWSEVESGRLLSKCLLMRITLRADSGWTLYFSNPLFESANSTRI
jgi:hypothetical protein